MLGLFTNAMACCVKLATSSSAGATSSRKCVCISILATNTKGVAAAGVAIGGSRAWLYNAPQAEVLSAEPL